MTGHVFELHMTRDKINHLVCTFATIVGDERVTRRLPCAFADEHRALCCIHHGQYMCPCTTIHALCTVLSENQKVVVRHVSTNTVDDVIVLEYRVNLTDRVGADEVARLLYYDFAIGF